MPYVTPRRALAGGAALALALAPAALAHEGEPLQPHDLWRVWSFEPGVVIPLALSAALYWRGSRGGRRHRGQTGAFWAGWWVLVAALVSPLHPLGEALFSAHMAQHVLLMTVAAPLLVLARPLGPLLRALPSGWRRAAVGTGNAGWYRRTWKSVSSPPAATVLQAGALWIWHVPRFYQATLTSESVHAFQHTCFLGTALLFWWAMIHGRGGRAGYGASFLCVFATAGLNGVLGALLTFAPMALYPAYGASTRAWGLTALGDQQLGGLIMWIPGGTLYILAGLALLALWIREGDRRLPRRPQSAEAAWGEM